MNSNKTVFSLIFATLILASATPINASFITDYISKKWREHVYQGKAARIGERNATIEADAKKIQEELRIYCC